MDEGLISILCSIPSIFCMSVALCLPGILYLFLGFKLITWVTSLFSGNSSKQVVSNDFDSSSHPIQQSIYQRSETGSRESHNLVDREDDTDYSNFGNFPNDYNETYRSENYEEKDEGSIIGSILDFFDIGTSYGYDDDDDD